MLNDGIKRLVERELSLPDSTATVDVVQRSLERVSGRLGEKTGEKLRKVLVLRQ